MVEPIIRNGKSRAELIGADFGNLPKRSWIFNGKEFQLTRLDFDNKELILDTQIKDLSGNIIFDDRVRLANPATIFINPDESREENFFKCIQETLDVVSDNFRGRKERIQGNIFKGDTLAVRAGTSDGGVLSNDAVFANMKAGSGLTADTTATTYIVAWSPGFSGRMYFVEFDTSALTAAATITAAVATLYGATTAEVNQNSYNLEFRYKDWGGTVTTADWFDPSSGGAWNALVAGGVLAVGSWDQTSGNANNFSDSGVYTSISKTSLTRFVVGLSGMNASTPTGLGNEVKTQSADASGTSADPLFTVTFSMPFVPHFAMSPVSIQRAGMR